MGDLIFITDVFPKDWTALLSGRPLEYLKVGSDAVNLSIYAGALSAQLIAVPFFEPDRLPQGRRLVGYDPFPGVPRQVAEPRPTVGNAELALRVSRYIGAVDAALYAYRGYWRSPPGQRFDGERVERFHPQLSVYAATVQGGLLSGVLSLEGGLYDSRQDRSGTDAAVENSQARLLVGYQRAFGDDLTVGLQYYREQMLDYESYGQTLPPDLPRRSETRHNATLRLTRLFAYQTVRASFFVWASPNEEDFYANPEVRYSVTDEMWAAVGANLFGGADEHTFFGQFDDNDNIYGTLRYGF